MSTPADDGLPLEVLFLLWGARKTGMLDALATHAGTPEAIAAAADVTPKAAETTVSALVEHGFLERVGDEYELTNRALGFLAKRDVRSIGELPRALDELDAWTRLPETMRTGEPPERPTDWTRNRLGADLATDEATVRARVTAAVREAPYADSVLVLAGGSGVHAREFGARGFDVHLHGDPDSVEALRPLLAPTDVTVSAGDPREVDGTYDLAFGADLCTRSDGTEASEAIDAVADALEPDGRLVLLERVGDRVEASVRTDARRLAFGAGGAHDEADYREWFAAARLAAVHLRAVPGADRTLVVGRRGERTVQGD